MNYLANHIELGKKRNRRLTKFQTRRKWIDEVYQTVSKKCFVVQDIIKRFNSIKGNSKVSRNDRIKTLSQLSVGFSYDTIVRSPVVLSKFRVCSFLLLLDSTTYCSYHFLFDCLMWDRTRTELYQRTCTLLARLTLCITDLDKMPFIFHTHER